MTAADAGFSMPPEWATQEAVWLSWPVDAPHWGGAKRDMMWAKFAEIAAALGMPTKAGIGRSHESQNMRIIYPCWS
jgi:agmatine deiminase